MKKPSEKSTEDNKANTHNKVMWTGGDLNPRPPECKSGVHTKLNYRPISAFPTCFHVPVIFRFCFENMTECDR